MTTGLLADVLKKARAGQGLPAPAVRRLLREEAGLTQGQLARVLGVSRVAITRWEGGSRTPRGAVLDSYLRVLDELRDELARKGVGEGEG